MKHEVLIGTVKNMNQLTANINGNFYHIPAAVVPKNMLPVEYVALYLPSSSFNLEDKGCIPYIGKVSDIKLVKRSEITALPTKNGDIDYYYFSVEEWKTLPNKIVRDKGGVYAKYFTDVNTLVGAEKLSDILDYSAVVETLKIRRSRPFSDEQVKNTVLIEDLITAKRLAEIINQAGYAKIQSLQITKYLTAEGYLKIKELGKKKYRVATEKGTEIGIFSDRAEKNGEWYYLTLYDMNAQQFVLDHINEAATVRIN